MAYTMTLPGCQYQKVDELLDPHAVPPTLMSIEWQDFQNEDTVVNRYNLKSIDRIDD